MRRYRWEPIRGPPHGAVFKYAAAEIHQREHIVGRPLRTKKAHARVQKRAASCSARAECTHTPAQTMQQHASWTKLSPFERFFMDETVAHNPVIITAFITLNQCPPQHWISTTLLPRLLAHPRFSARIVTPPNAPARFESIPDFSSDGEQLQRHHVVHEAVIDTTLPHEKRHQIFQTRLCHIISQPLPRHRPLWRVHFFPMWSIEPQAQRTQCATLVFRIHHVVGDGVGLVKYFMSAIVDNHAQRGGEQLVVPNRQRQAPPQQTAPRKLPQAQPPSGWFAHLKHALAQNWHALCTNVNAVIGTLVPERDNTFVRSELQPRKVCAVLPPSVYTVATLKSACRSLGITINDLMYAAVSGATRAYLQQCGDDVDALTGLRVGIPYNNHVVSKNEPQDVCNQFALMTLPLHVHHGELQERLRRCVRTMRVVKRGTTPALLLFCMTAVSRLPAWLRRPLWRRLTRSGSLVFTNVPGARQAVSVGGVEVSGLHFLAPSDGHCAVVVGVHSYNGRVCIGVYGDERRISDPQRFVQLLDEHIRQLIRFGDVKL